MRNSHNVSPAFAQTCVDLLQKLSEMGLLLTKMAIQCVDFCPYSPSVLVLAALYASTAFLKHSQQYHSEETTRFCTEVRQIIFEIHQEELNQHSGFLNRFQSQHPEITDMHMNIYQNQFSQDFVEQVAMDLVDFYKIFDDWHCGLNQLKKFNQAPFH